MQPISAHSVPATFREPPAELMIFSRSISDDDLCAWCRYLWYSPGESSLCQRHSGGDWPGATYADGYFRHCGDFSRAANNDAP